MHNEYRDLIDHPAGPPKWWDENGVPRFCRHHPSACPDIYAHEVVLLKIACQACKRQFVVQMSDSSIAQLERSGGHPDPKNFARDQLAKAIRGGYIHYGDPPNVNCCPGGATMNCDDLRVLEYWYRKDGMTWERDPSLEISLPDGGGE